MKNKIFRKIKMIDKALDFLNSLDLNEQRLENDYMLRSSVERNLHIALESMLDIGEMIISKENFEKPESYADVIKILGKEGILPEELAKRLENAARFRNVLVHLYNKIDTDLLYRNLKNLRDLSEFAKHIAKHCENW